MGDAEVVAVDLLVALLCQLLYQLLYQLLCQMLYQLLCSDTLSAAHAGYSTTLLLTGYPSDGGALV